MQKILASLFLVIFLCIPSLVMAQGVNNQTYIQQLLKQIIELQQILVKLLESNNSTGDGEVVTKPIVGSYHNNDLGISFNIPTNWKVDKSSESTITLVQTRGVNKGDKIMISLNKGKNITDSDNKFGKVNFFYENGKWMEGGSQSERTGEVILDKPVEAKLYTADNLPVFLGKTRWLTYIIPTKYDTILKLTITGSGDTKPLTDLVKTLKSYESNKQLKTYTNSNIGFSFNYPSSWYKQDNLSLQKCCLNIGNYNLNSNVVIKPEKSIKIQFQYHQKSISKSLKEIALLPSDLDGKVPVIEEIMIGGLNVIKSNKTTYYIPKSSTEYITIIVFSSLDSTNIADEVIASFKLLK